MERNKLMTRYELFKIKVDLFEKTFNRRTKELQMAFDMACSKLSKSDNSRTKDEWKEWLLKYDNQ